MSNNPQWKTFQPPIMNSDPAILDYKSMAIPTKKVVGGSQQSANTYRNGTNFNTGDHFIMDSPPESEMFPGSVTSPRNGATRFTSRTSMEGAVTGYTAEAPTTTNNSSTYQDQSNNQGPREAGIIEKLLVNVLYQNNNNCIINILL